MHRKSLILFLLYAVLIAAGVATGIGLYRNMQEQTRGIAFSGNLARTHPLTVAVNASLDQYSTEADLRRALALVRATGFRNVRQHFYWNAIEPQRGTFEWPRWDRVVTLAGEYDIEVTAVLDTTPEWARDPGERDLLNAPPHDVGDYARFVDAFVRRYGDRIRAVQLWDNPNVHPFWGRRVADPVEYTALLRAGALAARTVDSSVRIISAGLAANSELVRGHADYSDVLFLRAMYDAGARDYFDILAVKPYGMWTGPDDRRVGMDVFNFSRTILLRDEMVAHGDVDKPVWAVEFGWNALPPGWEGKPSPWGSDAQVVQRSRLVGAIERARGEWFWMQTMFIQTFQPDAPRDDPVWGFALVDANLQPRDLAPVTAVIASEGVPAFFDFDRLERVLVGLALVVLVALWRSSVHARRVAWTDGWLGLQLRLAAFPEPAQFALLAVTVAAFYYSRNAVLNFALLAAVLILFALRLDLGLVITVFTFPFYLFPKNLVGSMQFSLVEILTLVVFVAFLGRTLLTGGWHSGNPRAMLARLRASFTSLDLAVLLFVLAGIVSIRVAANFGVANREFRVIVFEPVLLYVVIRLVGLHRRDLSRLVDAFVLSALAISLIGLYQYLFTNYVIVGEGVRRVLAVYGSPNNLALYLDRALPVLVAIVIFGHDRRRRVTYALMAVPITLCWYLTWSRAAWIGLLAGLLLIGLFTGRRVRLALLALVAAGFLLLIPFLSTERAQSLFQAGSGTGFFRLSVMQSGLDMLRDHPIFGVGLDNFLYEYPKYIKPEAWAEPNLSHPHNILLDYWLRTGILGVVSLGWMLVEFYRRGWRALAGPHRGLVLGLLAGMTAALVHGMMDAAYFYVDLAFTWMLMLGIMANLRD